MPLRFVAIVDNWDQLIYFQSAPDTPHDLHVNNQFLAEMSLDFVEQQMTELQSRLNTPHLALAHDGIAVYAALTNTRTKFLIGISSSDDAEDISGVIQDISIAYSAFHCNPFGSKEGPIESPLFDKKIAKIIIGDASN